MYMVANPLIVQRCDILVFVFMHMVGRFVKVFMTMVFGVLNGVLPSPTFNVMHCKIKTNIIA